jgi:hypothetical protein
MNALHLSLKKYSQSLQQLGYQALFSLTVFSSMLLLPLLMPSVLPKHLPSVVSVAAQEL